MGVYIRDMEMPNEGEYYMTFYVCPDGSAYIDVASFPADEDRFEAVPVPPHGRLIDADRLGKIMCEGLAPSERDSGFKTPIDILRAIADAPTIIPAE